MLLQFFGTKGYVEESSRGHSGHSAFVLEEAGFRLLCDFGQNRKGMLSKIRPDAVFLSHAHPDHAWGLEEGTDAPVYASEVTHEILAKLPIRNRVVLAPDGGAADLGPFRLTPHPVLHSVRCPAIAARIATGGLTMVYSGDIVAFEDPDAALAGADLYIGDGSTLTGSLVRRHPERRPHRPHDGARPARLALAPRDPARDLLPLRHAAHRDGGCRARGGAREAGDRAAAGLRGDGGLRRPGAGGRGLRRLRAASACGPAAPVRSARPGIRAARASPRLEDGAARLAGALQKREQASRHQHVEAAPDQRDEGLAGHVDRERLDGRGVKLVGGILRDPGQAEHDGAVVGGDGEDAKPSRPGSPGISICSASAALVSRWKT